MENSLIEAPEKNGLDVSALVEMVDESVDATNENDLRAMSWRDYKNGDQLTATEIKVLADRKQPPVVTNRIGRKIEFLNGAEQQNRTDPKAYPRNPGDEDAAEAASDALRYVEEKETLDEKFSDIWENMLVEGYGGLELVIENKQKGPEIGVKCWEWDRLFYDPHSRKHDFSDAEYMGGIIWMDAEKAKRKYKDQAESFDEAINQTADTSEKHEDRPEGSRWAQGGRRKRVKIVQIYYLVDGEWYWCVFSKTAKIDGGPVPFKNEDGESFCPLFLQSAYVDRNNSRFGIVKDMISPQDEINKRRSKLLHQLNSRQTFGRKGAVQNVDKLKKELAKPDGHAEFDGGEWGRDFGIIPNGDQVQGQAELLLEAKNEIDLMGPNAAMQGKGEQEASGRSIMAQQQGGYVEITPLLNRLKGIKLRVYRGIWSLIRQYWTEERWVRVTDDEKNLKFVGFNKPVTWAEKKLEGAEDQMPPEQFEQFKQQVMASPLAQLIVETKNVPADMDMDLILDEAPDVVVLQQEQFDILGKMAERGVPIPPDELIAASSLRNKEQILKRMRGEDNPEAKQAAQEAQELQKAGAVAEIEETKSKAAKGFADAEKTTVETHRAAFELGLESKLAGQ